MLLSECCRVFRHELRLMVRCQESGGTVAAPAEYLKYFGSQPASEIENEIRAATNGNFALGSSRFQAEIEATLGRRVSLGRPGRPLKKKAPDSGDLFVS